MGYDFDNFKKNALTMPRDMAWSNWAKFEKEGDKVQGYIRDVFFRAEEKDGDGKVTFGAARGITLEQPDGVFVNVSIKRIPFILAKTDSLRLGDPLTVVFDKQLPPRQKGYKGAKQFGFYGTNLPENAGNKTVAELDKEDALKQGKENTDEAADKEFEEMVATAVNNIDAPAA